MTFQLSTHLSRLTEVRARMLAYAFGPFGAAAILGSRGHVPSWTVRFHAIHSLLLTAAWFMVWLGLELIESITPWLFGAMVNQAQFIMNLAALGVWVCLLISARDGSRFVVLPYVHQMAVRFARRHERRRTNMPIAAMPRTSRSTLAF